MHYMHTHEMVNRRFLLAGYFKDTLTLTAHTFQAGLAYLCFYKEILDRDLLPGGEVLSVTLLEWGK